jgi:hypothetical protein
MDYQEFVKKINAAASSHTPQSSTTEEEKSTDFNRTNFGDFGRADFDDSNMLIAATVVFMVVIIGLVVVIIILVHKNKKINSENSNVKEPEKLTMVQIISSNVSGFYLTFNFYLTFWFLLNSFKGRCKRRTSSVSNVRLDPFKPSIRIRVISRSFKIDTQHGDLLTFNLFFFS